MFFTADFCAIQKLPCQPYFMLSDDINCVSAKCCLLANNNNYIKTSPLCNDNQQRASHPLSLPPMLYIGCLLAQAASHEWYCEITENKQYIVRKKANVHHWIKAGKTLFF